MPQVERVVTLCCVSNEVGGEYVGNAVWQGVMLRDLLDRAGVQSGAEQVFSTSLDGWTCGFPVEAAFDGRDAMVVRRHERRRPCRWSTAIRRAWWCPGCTATSAPPSG